MKLVEIHLIKRGEQHFDEIDDLCFKSKNLFNLHYTQLDNISLKQANT